MDMLHKAFALEVKDITDGGTFHGIASVAGIEDLGGDIIAKGAWTKTLSERPTVPVLWQHQSSMVIGSGQMKEHQGKLLIDAELDMGDPVAVNAHRKMKMGLIKGLSVGFTTVKNTMKQEQDRFIRQIDEAKLWEVSVVTFPMLPDAQVTRVKALDATRRFDRAVKEGGMGLALTPAEKSFVEAMIANHQAAIGLATGILKQATTEEIVCCAAEIVNEYGECIDEMWSWLTPSAKNFALPLASTPTGAAQGDGAAPKTIEPDSFHSLSQMFENFKETLKWN